MLAETWLGILGGFGPIGRSCASWEGLSKLGELGAVLKNFGPRDFSQGPNEERIAEIYRNLPSRYMKAARPNALLTAPMAPATASSPRNFFVPFFMAPS